jgi:peptidoglycan/xylan/chitin deacetylase (PgdA/CDA1 family)
VFKEKNIGLTISVVGKNIDADTKQVYYYIKQRLMNNTGNDNNGGSNGSVIEIANHSWEHGRFLNFTLVEQSNSIRKTNEKIKSLFGIMPTIFIPPYFEYNNDTILAMHENNMRFISANDTDSTVYSTFSNSTIYHLPATAETGCNNCNATKSYASTNKSYPWHGVEHEETLNQIKKSIYQYGFAVVVMHPMEYSLEHDAVAFQNTLDLKQMRELELLIDKIQEEGLHIVTMGNMINHY